MNDTTTPGIGQPRTVLDGVGHSLLIEIVDGGIVILDAMDDASRVSMRKDEAEILHAFLSVSLKMPHREGFSEDLRNGRRLSLEHEGSPHVRITSSEACLDIHPSSWEPLLCEISLLLPRLKD